MYYREYLQKIAAKNKKENDVDLEKALIKQYQLTKDNMLMGRLERMFRGTINSAITRANTSGLPPVSVYNIALKYFKKAILSYEDTKGAQPSSWITQTIKWDLSEESRTYQNSARMSDKLVMVGQDKFNAETKLNLLGEPLTYTNIQSTIHDMKKGKAVPAISQLQHIDDLTRVDLSGGMTFGGDDTSENLTFEDVFNNTENTTDNVLQTQLVHDKLKQCLNMLTPLERDVIKDRTGGFDNSPTVGKKTEMRWELVALNNNLRSPHMAKKVYDSAMLKLTQMMEL